MIACVCGFGSIGKRHAEVLENLVDEVIVVTSHSNSYKTQYVSIQEALTHHKIDYIVIAKPTAEHFECLKALQELGFKGKILIEKPLFAKKEDFYLNEMQCYVAYQFRFHPLIDALKQEIGEQNVLSAQAYVGQYLPTWRPNTDYRQSYSAKKDQGGGVLRDLSHELDYLQYVLGPWKRLCALQSQVSSLEIDSDDCTSLIIEFEKVKQVTLELNYLDRIGNRYIIVNTDEKTIKVDFIEQTIQANNEKASLNIERNDLYKKQHLAVLNNDTYKLASFEDGVAIVDMIEKIEASSKFNKWVER